jgi:hypothetical protein
MTTHALRLLTALAVTAGAQTQSMPDFSGSWQLDLSRSDASAYADSPGPVRVSIKHSPTEIHITTTTSRGATDTTYKMVTADNAPLGAGPNARWQGDALVTNAVRDVRGQSVTVQQTRRLSSDGKEMIVESIVNVQHGYSAAGARTYGVSKDVFVKVREP